MRPQAYQTPEIRDENDSIIQQGTFGKKTPFVNSQNDGILDYIINNLEAIKGGQVNADWEITDNTDKAFIKNKPDLTAATEEEIDALFE